MKIPKWVIRTAVGAGILLGSLLGVNVFAGMAPDYFAVIPVEVALPSYFSLAGGLLLKEWLEKNVLKGII